MAKNSSTAAVTPAAPVVVGDPRFDEAKLQGLTTTSARIRYLHACGLKNGEIAKKLGKLYQHVRNVLIVPVKTPMVKEPVVTAPAVEVVDTVEHHEEVDDAE
jgi:hypothetical protein